MASRTRFLAADQWVTFPIDTAAQQLGHTDRNKPLPELASDGRWKLYSHSAAQIYWEKDCPQQREQKLWNTADSLAVKAVCCMQMRLYLEASHCVCAVAAPETKLELGYVLWLFLGDINKCLFTPARTPTTGQRYSIQFQISEAVRSWVFFAGALERIYLQGHGWWMERSCITSNPTPAQEKFHGRK